MVAFDTGDDAAADMLGVGDAIGQFGIGALQEQIGSRKRGIGRVADVIDQIVERPRRRNLRIGIEVLAENGKRLAVKIEHDVCVAAGAGGPGLVGAAEENRSGTREIDLLQIGSHDLDVAVVTSRDRVLRADIVGHPLEDRHSLVAVRRSGIGLGGNEGRREDRGTRGFRPSCRAAVVEGHRSLHRVRSTIRRGARGRHWT
ncbi:MAG: hypothetical protein WDM86_16870 [Rhizomicrobium sp.]